MNQSTSSMFSSTEEPNVDFKFPSLPDIIPPGSDMNEIEQQIHSVLNAIKDERRRLNKQREDTENRWALKQRLNEAVGTTNHLRILEVYNQAERELSKKERDVLEFYRIHFHDCKQGTLTPGVLNHSVLSPASVLSLDGSAASQSALDDGKLAVKIEQGVSPSQPISPFLQYLMTQRHQQEETTKKNAGQGTSPVLSQEATPESFRTRALAANASKKTTMSASNLEDMKKNLDAELQHLDRVLGSSNAGGTASTDLISSSTLLNRDGSSPRTTQRRTLAPGWTVRLQEYGSSDFADYKTVFVHQDATALEVLLMALRKWRYLSPKMLEEMKSGRLLITEEMYDVADREGWQILLAPTQYNSQLLTLSFDQLVLDVLPKELPANNPQPLFLFRKNQEIAVANQTHFEYSGSGSLVQPCYIFKLLSQYQIGQVASDDVDVEAVNWSSRFLVLAKSRYLLLFKTEHHARWAKNILHEIDMAKVASVSATPVRRVKQVGSKESDNVLTAFGMCIQTRSRQLYFCCDSIETRDNLVRQLNEVRKVLNTRLTGLPARSMAKQQDPTLSRMHSDLSTKSFENVAENPLQSMIDKLLATKRLNDVDCVAASDKAGLHLIQGLKAHAISKLTDIYTRNELMHPIDLLSSLKDGMISDANGKAGSDQQKVSTVRKLLKNLGGQGLTMQQSLSSPTSPTKTSLLFGCTLDESPTKETDKNGLTVPLIIVRCIEHLSQNGLETSGLFRIAGSVKRMEALRKVCEQAVEMPNTSTIDFAGYTVHDVAGILKMYLRELSEPLLVSRLYRPFVALTKLSDNDAKANVLRLLVALLPQAHRHTLELLMRFLSSVSVNSEDHKDAEGNEVKGNMMNAMNLAVCIAPNILRDKVKDQGELTPNKSKSPGPTASAGSLSDFAKHTEVNDSAAVVEVVKLMIENVDAIFQLNPPMLSDLQKLAAAPPKDNI